MYRTRPVSGQMTGSLRLLLSAAVVQQVFVTTGANVDFVIAKDITSKAILCAITDSTVAPFVTKSRLDCAHLCRTPPKRRQTGCVGFNYLPDTNTCEIFSNMPNLQASTSGCSFYGVCSMF